MKTFKKFKNKCNLTKISAFFLKILFFETDKWVVDQ